MSSTQRDHSMFIRRQKLCARELWRGFKNFTHSQTQNARLSQYSRATERALKRQGSSMRLINLIHISLSARHCQSTKMRPLRAYQSSADKLIHHGIIRTHCCLYVPSHHDDDDDDDIVIYASASGMRSSGSSKYVTSCGYWTTKTGYWSDDDAMQCFCFLDWDIFFVVCCRFSSLIHSILVQPQWHREQQWN
jgi:hypothetical protein